MFKKSYCESEKIPCHAERRIDLRVSVSHDTEIPKQVRNDMNPSPQPSPTRGEGVSSRVDFSLPLITGLTRSFHSLAMTKVAYTPLVKGGKRRGDYSNKIATSHTLLAMTKKNPTTANAVPLPLTREVKRCAFTLAEVLITLGIIGIVAAMTLPTVINKINDRENLQKFKKAYSELSQVKQLLDMEYGGSFTMACNTFDDVCLRDLFAEKMKVIKTCRSNAPNECQEKSYFQNGKQQFYGMNINHSWPMLITNSGYSVKFRFHFPDCASYNSVWTDKDGNLKELKTCGWMQIDTNGKKKPNHAGKDIYFILIYKDKLIPVDTKNCSDEGLLDDCEPLQW